MTLAHTRLAAASAASATLRAARGRFRQRAAATRLARRSKTAQAKIAGLPIRPGERVLTLDHAPVGSLVAATAAAVYLSDQGEPGRTWSRVGWEEVIRTGWDDRRRILALTGAGPSGMWREELAVDRDSALVELARERVSATLLASAAIRYRDRICAVVMARRLPGSGKVIWVTLLNQTGDTEDQAVRAKAAAAIAALGAQTGIPAG
jgi:hypothetical protein